MRIRQYWQTDTKVELDFWDDEGTYYIVSVWASDGLWRTARYVDGCRSGAASYVNREDAAKKAAKWVDKILDL